MFPFGSLTINGVIVAKIRIQLKVHQLIGRFDLSFMTLTLTVILAAVTLDAFEQ